MTLAGAMWTGACALDVRQLSENSNRAPGTWNNCKKPQIFVHMVPAAALRQRKSQMARLVPSCVRAARNIRYARHRLSTTRDTTATHVHSPDNSVRKGAQTLLATGQHFKAAYF